MTLYKRFSKKTLTVRYDHPQKTFVLLSTYPQLLSGLRFFFTFCISHVRADSKKLNRGYRSGRPRVYIQMMYVECDAGNKQLESLTSGQLVE